MAPQFDHVLPNGERLISVDVETAREYLSRVVASFEAGNNEPLIIGNEAKPQAVVLPIAQWLHLQEIADEASADQRLADEARASIDEGGPATPYEEVLETIYDPRKDRDNG